MLERLEEVSNIKIYGPKDASKRASVITVNIGNMDSGEITFLLDSEYDIATRSGIHCAPLAHKTLGTLEQLHILLFLYRASLLSFLSKGRFSCN